MTRRTSLRTVLLAALASPALTACTEPAPPRSDVLLLSLDTLRADHLSCYGYERRTSPFLDRMAAEGVRFAEAMAPASNTAPSHMSLFTGLDPLAHGIRPMGGKKDRVRSLSPETPTLAETLRDAGYQTVGIADNGYVDTDMGFDRGFELFDNRRTNLAHKLTLLSGALKSVDPARPLFLFFHTYETHAPYLPPPPFRGRFTDDSYRGPFRERYDRLVGLPVGEAWREKKDFLDTFEGMGERDLDFLRGLYDEGIAYTDSLVQRLWRIWSQRRDADSTLFVIVSDHGEGFGEHGKLGHKYGLYEELLRIPLIVRGPGLEPRVVEEPVSLTDLVPTLHELLDLPLPAVQGQSLVPLLRGESLPGRAAFSQLNAQRGLHDSIVRGDHHLMRWERPGGDRVEFYDLEAGTGERLDLAEGAGTDADELIELLDARRELGAAHNERFPHLVGGMPSEEKIQNLGALGYLDDEDEELDEGYESPR